MESDTNGCLCTKIQGKVVKFLTEINYIIGDIYLTTNIESPAQRYGGGWERLTHDAYLKIVNSNAGELNGTSAFHKLSIEHMPSHKHQIAVNEDNGIGSVNSGCCRVAYGDEGMGYYLYNQYPWSFTGSNQPYYPYFYGIYVWIKRSM